MSTLACEELGKFLIKSWHHGDSDSARSVFHHYSKQNAALAMYLVIVSLDHVREWAISKGLRLVKTRDLTPQYVKILDNMGWKDPILSHQNDLLELLATKLSKLFFTKFDYLQKFTTLGNNETIMSIH